MEGREFGKMHVVNRTSMFRTLAPFFRQPCDSGRVASKYSQSDTFA
jgi:hypothetical protein